VSLQPGDPRLRASDADREAVAERLREAHAQGRLTVEEFSERLDATYASRTHGELVPITEDLPADRPAADVARPEDEDDDGSLRGAWLVWATAVLVNVVIWGIASASTGELVYFWPGWVAGPWGAVLLARTLFR
jgi:hypothetical protein